MPDSEVIRAMREFKRGLLASEREQMQDMARRWLGVERRLEAQMSALALEMDGVLRDGGIVSRETLMTQVRYRELLVQLQDELGGYTDYAEVQITAQQRRLARLGIAHAENALKVQGVTAGYNRLPVEAVQYMAGLAGNGSPLRTLLAASWPLAAEGLTQELVNGVALGYNPRKTARLMAQGMAGSLDRMMTIARNEQLRVYRTASLESYKASGVVKSYVRLSARDNRVCAGCLAADGKEYDLAVDFQSHVQCVIEGTIVLAPSIIGTSKRAYNGLVFDIVTERGNHLTVTPNHPVLTDKGWIAAHLLHEGDNVISSRGGDGAALFVAPNEQQRPAAIEDIVKAFSESSNMPAVSMKVSAKDFHSDGMGSDVAVVNANRFLLDDLQPAFSQQVDKLPFAIADVSQGFLYADRSLDFGRMGLWFSSLGIMGCSDKLLSLLRSPLSLHQSVGRGAITNDNASFQQAQADHISTCPKCGRQSVLGFAGKITGNNFLAGQREAAQSADAAPLEMAIKGSFADFMTDRNNIRIDTSKVVRDRIVNLSCRQFSGHVYNLQTVTGWYVSNGIITHNCRCTLLPKIEGIPLRFQNGTEWFAEQPAATQREILGPGRYDLWAAGHVGFAEFATLRPNAIWGDAIVPTPLRELAGG